MSDQAKKEIKIDLKLALEIMDRLDSYSRDSHMDSESDRVYFKFVKALEENGVVMVRR